MDISAESLKELDFFSSLNDEELHKLTPIAEEISLCEGDKIITENERCLSLFFIKRGSVSVHKANGLSMVLGVNSTIGELSFIDKGTASAGATAAEDCVLIRMPEEAFEKLVQSDAAFGSKVFRSIAMSLCQKLRDTNEWLSTKDWLADIEKEARRLPII